MKRDRRAALDPQVTEAEENFLIDCQFLVQDLINAGGISRTELARRAGISKSRLSQILSAEANPSVKTFARLFHVLGAKVTPPMASFVSANIFPPQPYGPHRHCDLCQGDEVRR